MVGDRNGRVVTNTVRSPVRPTRLWIRAVSIASARVIAGRIVVSRRASIDVPALYYSGNYAAKPNSSANAPRRL